MLPESDLVEVSAVALGFLPEFLKSVSYQPVPLSLKEAAVTCLRNAELLQSGQSVSLGSLIFCRASIW